MADVVLDRFDKLFDALEAAAPNAFARDLSEPAFDQIQPRGTGRREMQMEPPMAFEPGLDFGMFMRGVVVNHQMQLSLRWSFPIKLA